MEEVPGVGSGSRRNEDIALDLMKFVAMTTGYGRTASSGGVGFSGGGAAAKPEDVEAHKKYALGATDEGKADPAEEENDVEAHQRHQNL